MLILIKRLKDFYPSNNQSIEVIAENWWSYFKDIDFKELGLAIRYHIAESSRFPTIADLNNQLKAIRETDYKAIEYKEDPYEVVLGLLEFYPNDERLHTLKAKYEIERGLNEKTN